MNAQDIRLSVGFPNHPKTIKLVFHPTLVDFKQRLGFPGGVSPTWSLIMPLPKHIVRLTDEERAELDELIRTGKRAASVLIHARILLKADAGANGPG